MSAKNPIIKRIEVKDLRNNSSIGKSYKFDLRDSNRCEDLYQSLTKKLGTKEFVLCFPNRTRLTTDNYQTLSSGQVINIYETVDQKIKGIVKYEVNIAPHPDTITKSGMYEYYDSRGIDSVVISIAELIDNSLAATKNNPDLRLIEVRFYDNGADSMLVILDNGHGMDTECLGNWARFKYSKFVRKRNQISNSELSCDDTFATPSESGVFSFSSDDLPLRPQQSSTPTPSPEAYRPRYLDSDINYFGAGGKQAIFNIGETTTMFTCPVMPSLANADRPVEEINELTLSKEKFDNDSKYNPGKVYDNCILQTNKWAERVLSENPKDSEVIQNSLIREYSKNYKCFSICCIKDVFKRHLPQLRCSDSKTNWTKGLARIYHYYLHGPNGNTGAEQLMPTELKNLRIYVEIFDVKKMNGTIAAFSKTKIDLKTINDDFETQLVRSSADTFEFEIEHYHKKDTKIEGVIRYHPYLHDRETLPSIPVDEELGETSSLKTCGTEMNFEDNEDFKRSETLKHRTREVFECFWHGRLIPQECIDFDWTKFDPKKQNADKDMEECYNRLSGTLFTNYAYEVSQNKQSFMNLRKLMSQTDCLTFFKIENGVRVRKRLEFEKQFLQWIANCHTKYDKQVLYKQYKGEVERIKMPSLAKKFTRTDIFSVFNAIEWRNRIWQKGDKIQTRGTKPSNLIGTIERFLVPIKLNSEEDYTGSPGVIEIMQIPAEIYGTGEDASKIIMFRQINVESNPETIERELENLSNRLPKSIEISFPQRFPIKSGDQIPAGRTIGDIKVVLKNSNDEELKTDRIPYKASSKKLSIQVDILRVKGQQTEVEIEYPIAKYSKQWESYWFLANPKGIEKAGKYRIACVSLNINQISKEVTSIFANGLTLPAADYIDFTVVAGPPVRFQVVDKNPIALIGKTFNLSLEFYDSFENIAKPDSFVSSKPDLKMGEFKVTFEKLESINNKLIIKNIAVFGRINSTQNEKQILEITIPSIDKAQEVAIDLKIGNPSKISLLSELKLDFMNGSVPEFGALVYDSGDNDVTFAKSVQLFCKIMEFQQKGQKTAVSQEFRLIDGLMVDKRILIMDKEIAIKATDILLSERKFFIRFYLKSDPRVCLEKSIIIYKSSKPALMRLFFTNTVNGGSESIEIINGKTLEFPAGSALSGVFVRVFDCEGNEIDLSERALAGQTLNVSWVNKPVIINANGLLPQIPIHRDCLELKRHRLEWKQLKKNIHLEHVFQLQPFADSAQRLSLNTVDHPLVFAIGQVVPNPISVSIVDSYNNIIRSLDVLNRIVIQSDSQHLIVDEKVLKKYVPQTDGNISNTTSFIISNIKLLPNKRINSNQSLVGPTRLVFSIRGMEGITDSLAITVVNGMPVRLNWLNSKINCITIMNNRRLQLQTQLCDEFDNPVVDKKQTVRLVLGENFIPKEMTSETDENGIATFADVMQFDFDRRIASDCDIPSDFRHDCQRCRTVCFGIHKIIANIRSNKSIKLANIWLHVLCDSNNPIKLTIISYGDLTVVAKSENTPTFSVKLWSENIDNPVQDFDRNKICMHLIEDGNPETYLEFAPKDQKTPFLYTFRLDEAPARPNRYRVKFICIGTKIIESEFEELINVIPGQPCRLLLKSEPLKVPIVVTNVGNERSIIDSPITLDLVDNNNVSIYKNICEYELSNDPTYCGRLVAQIICKSDHNYDTNERIEVPELDGCDEQKRLYFPISVGKVTINEMLLKENTRGVDNGIYLVELRALIESRREIDPFRFRIMFCDDTGRQAELSQIQIECQDFSRQRDEIRKELNEMKKELKTQNEKYNRIRNKELDYMTELKRFREEPDLTDLSDERKIRSKLIEYQKRFDDLNEYESNRTTRGINGIDVVMGKGVIAKIADLAYVRDEESAKSISWFLRNHMNCVVTTTSEVAEAIRGHNGINSTISIDRIDPELDTSRASYPHESVRGFPLRLNIEFLRMKLINELNQKYRQFEPELRRVLTAILSNTLFADNISDADLYRKRVIEKTRRNCPTIVTKNGVVFDNGIIDTSCPLEDNHLVMFQSPPNREFIKVKQILDILTKLLNANIERVKEYELRQQLTKDYEEFEIEKRSEMSSLDTSINLNQNRFKDLSNTALSLLSEDDSDYSLHPSHSRRDSVTDRRRRSRSYSRHSDSDTNSKRRRMS